MTDVRAVCLDCLLKIEKGEFCHLVLRGLSVIFIVYDLESFYHQIIVYQNIMLAKRDHRMCGAACCYHGTAAVKLLFYLFDKSVYKTGKPVYHTALHAIDSIPAYYVFRRFKLYLLKQRGV